MYAHHFGLNQDPFSIAPDPRYLFMSERHREALAHLLYGVSGGTGGGFVLLTGDIGTGKTTLCRRLLEQVPGGCHVAYLLNPRLTVAELLQSVCEEFHLTGADAPRLLTARECIDALNAFLLRSHAAGQSAVLIIDEAQNLSADVLEQLRLLTNLETSERKLLQIVLIGQPELRAMLARPELEQLAQRVVARFHLGPLLEAETMQYIAHRLGVAGHSGALPFDRPALQRIHRLARGVPRRINLLCGRALLGAWANGLKQVDGRVVDQAAAEVFGTETSATPAAGRRAAAYALGGIALLAGAALAAFLMVNTAPLLSAAPPMASASALPLPAAPVSAPVRLPVKQPEPMLAGDIETLLPQLPGDLNAAWRELAPAWKLDATEGDPCQAASAQLLQCYRTGGLTVPLLRQLDRPGILTLQADNGRQVHVALIGLGDETATLQVAGKAQTVRLVSLARLWRGDFGTYWRPPPGYGYYLSGGGAGLLVERLARQLGRLDGTPAAPVSAGLPVLDRALRERIRAFQRAHGLQPDGQPGPLTFMQIDSASGADSPRLLTPP